MTREANKAVIRAHFQALNAGDAEAFAATHDPAGVNHAPAPFDVSPWPPAGKPFGPHEARGTLAWLRSGLADLHAEVEDLVAEGDQVVAWVRMTGNHAAGPTAGVKRVDVHHAHRFRLAGGRIVEHWAVRDDLRAMIQRGLVQPPGPPPGAIA